MQQPGTNIYLTFGRRDTLPETEQATGLSRLPTKRCSEATILGGDSPIKHIKTTVCAGYTSVTQETCRSNTPFYSTTTTCKGSMPSSLSLELEVPHIRPEAFPWESANNFEIHASCSLGSFHSVAILPSVIHLGTLHLSPEEGRGESVTTTRNMDVEILGNDNGVTFALGKASIPLPEGQLEEKFSAAEHAFRVSLVGTAGMRTGTLVGAFRSRDSLTRDPSYGGPALTGYGIVSAAAESLGKAVSEAAGQGIDNEASKESTRKVDVEWLENQAIELLDATTKILASSSLRAKPQSRPCDEASPRALGCEDKRGHGVEDVLPAQVSGILSENEICGFKLMPHGSVGDSHRKTSHEEDQRQFQPRFPTAGFTFEPTTGNVEWQRIASVNVPKVEREGDLQTLKQFLPEIAVGELDEDDIDANPGLLKAFRLAQLQTQYLLHCQQVLQRQCNGLQSAVATMETEVDGNSQGTIAIKNRARLLRKESRKQDKIINSYAALLRRHNPGLASKVFLDEKGRLKVLRVGGEVTRHRTRGKRSTRGPNHSHGHGDDDALNGRRKSENKGHSGRDACRGNPDVSSRSSSHWSETGGRTPRAADNPGPRSEPSEKTADAPGERASFYPIDAGEKRRGEDPLAAPVDSREESVAEHGRSTDAAEASGKPTEALRADGGGGGHQGDRQNSEDRGVTLRHSQNAHWQGCSDVAPAGREARMSAGAAEVLAGKGSGNEIGFLSASCVEGIRRGPGRGSNRLDALSTGAESLETPQNGSQEGMFVAGARVGDDRPLFPSTDAWERAGSDSSKSREFVVIVGSGSRAEDADAQTCVENGTLKMTDRTPRLVTVTVKPKAHTPPASASSPEQGGKPFPQNELQRHHHREDLRPSTSSKSGDNDHSNSNNNNNFCPRNGVGSSEISPGVPSSADNRHEVGASGNASPALVSDVHSERIPISGGKDTLEAASSKRRVPSDESRERDNHLDGTMIATPVADASRLGLEGDEFPDLSDFDVDNISEIDVGGEWAGSEGVRSLSS